ncbi:MAG: glycosyltransferase family 4 protein [Actinobacteria bacterium]|nr:glycosyltransferase family 4 protein [Actinomycetota bacterium]
MRVLHVTHSGAFSGGEIALARLVPQLLERGFGNVVACGAEGPLAEHMRACGVPVVVAALPRTLAEHTRAQPRAIGLAGALPATLVYALRVARTARRLTAGVIHTSSMKAHVGGMLAGWLTRTPVIVHLRDDLNHVRASPAVLTLFGWLLHRVPSAVIGCSGHVLRVADVAGIPTAVVYSGVPSELVHHGARPPTGDPVVGMVARIAEWKGQHLFLDAAEIVARAEPRVRFRIVGAPLFGEDAYLARLEEQVQGGALAGRVELTGFTTDPTHEYDRLAVAVAYSTEPEPFGQVVVEAMARGCAVVAPAEGGPLEIVTPDVDGVLVPPRDAGALAEAILRLVRDEPLRTLLGARAAETVKERFTVETTAEGFVDLLDQVAHA